MSLHNCHPVCISKKRLTSAACKAPLLFIGVLLGLQSASIAGPQTEVHVTLLGQPCLIQGPFDELVLKSIHSIGPAQIYPTLSLQNIPSSLERSRKALEKIRSSSNLHSLLDRYREKLRKRIEAQVAFMTALQQSHKTNQASTLLKTAAQYLQGRDLRSFESLLKKNHSFEKANAETLDTLFDLFNEAIEPDPEAEFHRAIKKLKIQYTCSFEENDEAASE
ncbi:MAG: hypothetical protein ABIQ95_08865 [Bdellovibrionia bacterium]